MYIATFQIFLTKCMSLLHIRNNNIEMTQCWTLSFTHSAVSTECRLQKRLESPPVFSAQLSNNNPQQSSAPTAELG